jgi:integrase
MATINFLYRSTKPMGAITVRFYVSGNKDLKYLTQLIVPKKYWDSKKQRVKVANDFPDAHIINDSLIKLEAHIMLEHNSAYVRGEDIDGDWLRKCILLHFNRPKYELENKQRLERETYFYSFAKYFFDEIIDKGLWKDARKKVAISRKSVDGYGTTMYLLEKYVEETKDNVKLKDVNVAFCERFTNWMQSKSYRTNYISKNIGRIRFFMLRAEEAELEVNREFKSRAFSAPTEATVSTYLNLDEIKKIHLHKFEFDSAFDVIRDWLVIGCFTGLRVSDFLSRLSNKNLDGDIIQLKTGKTGTNVAIPLHPYIKTILAKRNGEFPRTYSDQKFNKIVKDVCMLAGIDNEIFSDIYDKETGRKQQGVAPKYLAVSSHICRRSFATNHFGNPLISTDVIMKVGGWKTESAFLKYLRKTNTESAEQLKAYWDSQINNEVINN